MTQPYFEKNNGLRFSCTQCGNCCTRPGPVFFSQADLERASNRLSVPSHRFIQKYKLFREEGVWALEPPDGVPCPFYDAEVGCVIYADRPTQCRAWPFWPEVVQRKRSWARAARDCPGMNRGQRHSPQDIRGHLDACRADSLPQGDPW